MSVKIYFSSVGGSRELKEQQSKIFQFLDAKKIKYQPVDISQDAGLKDEMRQKTGNPSALPPQVFNGNKYCGDYQAFFDAVEDGKGEKFFQQ
ncbi:SH3 domain-binding glutamic acid-rich-like protein 3 [Hoplias malabaricus]|uniref:SH3 domain-binding glutamic acid-rich-like protein 3 n=1 Tax=Hoplias malabaricus TaxID=27720 RepID=UPI003461D902